MNRFEQIIPTGIILAVGLWIALISFTQQPSEAFLFPRIFSSVFVVLSIWTFIEALLGRGTKGEGLNLALVRNFAPGLIITVIYLFWAAKFFGFYTATAVTFFILLSIYDPNSHKELKSWGKRALITAVFIAVMYGLFAKILKVYTPREILF